jgi:hypothetical protein
MWYDFSVMTCVWLVAVVENQAAKNLATKDLYKVSLCDSLTECVPFVRCGAALKVGL